MEMTFEQIDILQENYKLVELQNFLICLQEDYIRDVIEFIYLNSPSI